MEGKQPLMNIQGFTILFFFVLISFYFRGEGLSFYFSSKELFLNSLLLQ